MDFSSASLAEMRKFTKDNGIKGCSAMKKAELAQFLMNYVENHVTAVSVEGAKEEPEKPKRRVGRPRKTDADKSKENKAKNDEEKSSESKTVKNRKGSSETEKKNSAKQNTVAETGKTAADSAETKREENEAAVTGAPEAAETSGRTVRVSRPESTRNVDRKPRKQTSYGERRQTGYQEQRQNQRHDQSRAGYQEQRRGGYQSSRQGSYQEQRQGASYQEQRQNNYQERQTGYQEQQRGGYQERSNGYQEQHSNNYQERQTGYQEQAQSGEYQEKQDGYQEQQRGGYQEGYGRESAQNTHQQSQQEQHMDLDSGRQAHGILEVMADGYGFIRSANYLPGDQDIYVSPAQIRKIGLKTGDIVTGNIRIKTQGEKFSALLYVSDVNGEDPSVIATRKNFEDLTPIFPNERIELDGPGAPIPIRMINLLSPIGKGQRGMIVSPPKTGKTTLLKQIAKKISTTYEDMNLLVLLIDERPEEVTDIRESIEGPNVEVIYSTFDELPDHHRRVSEMVIERAKRLVESGRDVVILLDSITRLARAYNITVAPSGRTLSGGLDPAALHMPKKFFGAARNMREGGSLTVLATALVETGSKMDDVVFEEFKGTGNMELVLDRKLSEKRIFPAIDIAKSGTRRDDLLLTKEEQDAVNAIHKELSNSKSEDILEDVRKLFVRTKDNKEFVHYIQQMLRS